MRQARVNILETPAATATNGLSNRVVSGGKRQVGIKLDMVTLVE